MSDTDQRLEDLYFVLAAELEARDRPGIRALARFVWRRRRGEPVPEETLAILDAAFRRVLDGESADVALGLVRSRKGRPRSFKTTVRNQRLARRLAALCSEGLTEDQAIERVQIETEIGEETLRSILKTYTVTPAK